MRTLCAQYSCGLDIVGLSFFGVITVVLFSVFWFQLGRLPVWSVKRRWNLLVSKKAKMYTPPGRPTPPEQ